jgi:hypothetical protein
LCSAYTRGTHIDKELQFQLSRVAVPKKSLLVSCIVFSHHVACDHASHIMACMFAKIYASFQGDSI